MSDNLSRHIPNLFKKPLNKLAAYGSTDVEYRSEPVVHIKLDELTGIWTVTGTLNQATVVFTGKSKEQAKHKYIEFIERYTTHNDKTEPDYT